MANRADTRNIIDYGLEPPHEAKPIWGNDISTEDNIITSMDFQASLQKLTSAEREIVELLNQGYSIREMAEMINLPVTTTHRIKDRAINKLKEMMNGEDNIYSLFT